MQQVDDKPDMATLKHAEGTLTVTFECPECGKTPNITSERLLSAVTAGQGVIIKCPAEGCGKWVGVSVPKAHVPRIQPASVQVMNREARRTMQSMQRRGLIQVTKQL